MMRNLAIGLAIAVAVLLGVLIYREVGEHRAPSLTTAYQAVLMSNGMMVYGRMEKAGTDFPVLREVHTLQSTTNPDTKQVTTALVRRNRDLHQPDLMILNARQIVAIEPVKADSQVGKILEQNAASH